MLTVLTLTALAVIGVVLLLGFVVVGIRQEPPWTALSEVAPSPIAVTVRRLCGLHIRRSAPTGVADDQQQERSARAPSTGMKTPTYPRG